MVGFDEALSILENPTRRQILRKLVKEPHYPLQLSELLNVSQQAVVKHLKVLEESGFVDSERVPSEKGGPPKKMYKVNQSFSLRLDLGPDLFRAEHRKIPAGGPMRLSNRLPPELNGVVDRMGTRRKLPMIEAMGVLSELDSALERIDEHRDAVIALHQQVMRKVSPSISEQSESYEERQLAHAIMNQPRRPLDLDAFSQGLRIQSMDAEEMMDALRERLMRDFAASRGRLVAAREGTPLPWWLAR
ncbi:MAG: ArsR family transcriptional regulator [Candidatus Poseidoniales archaeon]|nr:MAG: ArsR family transcriptional regulator [Candidatus Poseidoniales archaeon]